MGTKYKLKTIYTGRTMRVGDAIRGYFNVIGTVVEHGLSGTDTVFYRSGIDGHIHPGADKKNYKWVNGAWDIPDDEQSVRKGRD